MLRFKRSFYALTAIGVLLVLAIQAVPYGHGHDNPPSTSAMVWDSSRTEELVRRACYDCHSNETRWPWYSYLAPLSWRIQHNVNAGREDLNFSRFDLPQEEAHESSEEVEEGEMPPWEYLILHPAARLTDAERRDLVRGLKRTLEGKRSDAGSDRKDGQHRRSARQPEHEDERH